MGRTCGVFINVGSNNIKCENEATIILSVNLGEGYPYISDVHTWEYFLQLQTDIAVRGHQRSSNQQWPLETSNVVNERPVEGTKRRKHSSHFFSSGVTTLAICRLERARESGEWGQKRSSSSQPRMRRERKNKLMRLNQFPLHKEDCNNEHHPKRVTGALAVGQMSQWLTLLSSSLLSDGRRDFPLRRTKVPRYPLLPLLPIPSRHYLPKERRRADALTAPRSESVEFLARPRRCL